MVVAHCDEERSWGHHRRHGETLGLRARRPDQCGGEAGGAARPQTRGFMAGGWERRLTNGVPGVNAKGVREDGDAGTEGQHGGFGWLQWIRTGGQPTYSAQLESCRVLQARLEHARGE